MIVISLVEPDTCVPVVNSHRPMAQVLQSHHWSRRHKMRPDLRLRGRKSYCRCRGRQPKCPTPKYSSTKRPELAVNHKQMPHRLSLRQWKGRIGSLDMKMPSKRHRRRGSRRIEVNKAQSSPFRIDMDQKQHGRVIRRCVGSRVCVPIHLFPPVGVCLH
jgi:hypothetical protein